MIWSLRHVQKWKETGDWGRQEGGVKVVKTIYAVLKSLTGNELGKNYQCLSIHGTLNENLILNYQDY